MKEKYFLILAVFAAGSCSLKENKSATTITKTNQPNIIYILADDMGYGDPSVYNAASKINTPNIDAFASEGIRLTDAHAPSSVCTPSRYGILTGNYCWRSRLPQGVLSGYGQPLI
ncbi:MAG: sulfatase-like hydrolase/transferase, partial [Bacteroidetes bacterium]|nr:sulfatase-like hydrolase/transferase [Bacteroidota bacterium]